MLLCSIHQEDDLTSQLGNIAAMTMWAKFRDTSKATHNYLSSMFRKSSIAVISENQRKDGFGKEENNNISESNFASATQSLKTYGTIRLDSAAAEGQTRTNNDFGRGHEQLINITKKTVLNTAKPGLIFQLPPKLVKSLFYAAKRALRLLNVESCKIEQAERGAIERVGEK
jgi:hypothetical protein